MRLSVAAFITGYMIVYWTTVVEIVGLPLSPMRLDASEGMVYVLFNLLLAWPLAMVYLRCVLGNAGTVVKGWETKIDVPSFVTTRTQEVPLLDVGRVVGNGSESCSGDESTFCSICQHSRPARAHHCRRCGHCVLRMDHHCPWLNNCVGVNNYRFFLQLLLLVPLCCALALLLICARVWSLTFGSHATATWGHLLRLLASTMVAGTGVAIGFTQLCQHGRLASMNLTSIEEHDYNFQMERARFMNVAPVYTHGYDHGALTNMRLIMGQWMFLWLLPVHIPLGDSPNGYYWKQHRQNLEALKMQVAQVEEKVDGELRSAGLLK